MIKKFIGLWRLIPQACKYDVGQAPLKATYHLFPLPEVNIADPKSIGVKIAWTDVNSKEF